MPEQTNWGKELRERRAFEAAKDATLPANILAATFERVVEAATSCDLPFNEPTSVTRVISKVVQTEQGNKGIVYHKYNVSIERIPFKDEEQLATLDD